MAALEYASNVHAQVTGKPAPAIFRTALAELGAEPAQAVMIGDDIESDIGGAQAMGLQTVLVRTGKYRKRDEEHPRIRPDKVIDDFQRAVVEFVCPRLADPGSGPVAPSAG